MGLLKVCQNCKQCSGFEEDKNLLGGCWVSDVCFIFPTDVSEDDFEELFKNLNFAYATTFTYLCPSTNPNESLAKCTPFTKLAFLSYPVIILTDEALNQLNLPIECKPFELTFFDYKYIILISFDELPSKEIADKLNKLILNIEPFETQNLILLSEKE